MASTIMGAGIRIECDDYQQVFVMGAYNQGCVLETRENSTGSPQPGMGLDHVQTAGGEDYFIISPNASPYGYGIAEIDFGLITSCADTYTVGDEIPCIPYHMNPGAYLRNIVCVDPASSDVSPDEPLHSKSGAAGSFIAYHTETIFVDSDSADGEAFADGTVAGAITSAVKSRINLKQAYFLADPSLAYDTVAYIVLT